MGRLLTTTSFVWMFWPLIDAGLSELFIRDVAGRRELFASYAGRVMRMKLALAVVAFLAMSLAARSLPGIRIDLVLVMLLGLALITESYTTVLRAVFRIQERMHWEAVLWAADGLLKLGVVVAALWIPLGKDPLLIIGGGWLAASIIGVVLAAWAVRRWWPWGAQITTGRSEWLTLLHRSVPFMLVYGLSLATLRGMVVLVGVLRGYSEAGSFGAAERLLEALQVIPVTLGQALLPVSARLAVNQLAVLRRVAFKALGMALGCALAVAAGFLLFGEMGVRLIFGTGFIKGGALISLLGCAVVPLFLKPVAEKILCGLHRQHTVWHWYLAVSICTVMISLMVVPSRGLLGAATCLLVSETITVIGLFSGLWYAMVHLAPVAAGAPRWAPEQLGQALAREFGAPS